MSSAKKGLFRQRFEFFLYLWYVLVIGEPGERRRDDTDTYTDCARNGGLWDWEWMQ